MADERMNRFTVVPITFASQTVIVQAMRSSRAYNAGRFIKRYDLVEKPSRLHRENMFDSFFSVHFCSI